MSHAAQIAPQPRQEPRPSSNRVARYCADLDARLDACPNDAARELMLSQQLNYWVAAYNRFALAIDIGALDPPPNGPDVHDYLFTICEINVRQARYRSAR